MSLEAGIFVSRLLVVNWSLHQAKLYEPFMRDGTVFAGDNGSGKTTAFDAILTVLLGSTRRSNYNQAATAKSAEPRNFLNYVIGKKEGSEAPGIREGMDFTTHLAVEFSDAMRGDRIVFGLMADHRGSAHGSDLVTSLYSYEGSIPESRFIADSQALSSHDAKMLLKEMEQDGQADKVTFYNTQQDYRRSFLAVMGIADAGYFSALRNLVALRSDMRIEDFIYQYLCEGQERASADDLNQVLDSWQSCSEELSRAKSRLRAIDTEKRLFDQWREARNDSIALDRAISLVKVELLKSRQQAQSKELDGLKESAIELRSRERELDNKLAAKRAKAAALQNGVDSDETLTVIAGKRARIETLQSICDDAQSGLDEQFERLGECDSALRGIFEKPCGDARVDELANALLALLQKALDSGVGVFGDGRALLKKTVSAADALAEEAETRIADARVSEAEARRQLEKANEEIRRVSSAAPTNRDVDRLIAHLRDRAGCDAVCLCDAIDLKEDEEAWRLAVEGVLGRRRSDVLVPPDQFERAVDAYRTYPGPKRQRLINTPGVIAHMKGSAARADSLASKVLPAEGPCRAAARAYLDWSLGRVTCCGDIKRFMRESPAGSAVTVEGERYEGFSFFLIRKDMLADALIGRKATETRRALIREQELQNKRDAERAISHAEMDIAFLKAVAGSCPTSRSPFGQAFGQACDGFDRVSRHEAEIGELKSAIDALEQGNGDRAKLVEELRELKGIVSQLEEDRAEASRSRGRVDEKIERGKEEAAKLAEKLVEAASAAGDPLPDPALEERARSVVAENDDVRRLEERASSSKGATGRAWNALVSYRRTYSGAVSSPDLDIESTGNEVWEIESERIRGNIIPGLERQFSEIEEEAKRGFTTSIVSKLRNGIASIRSTIRSVNRLLRDVPFGDIRYRFVCEPNRDYQSYYDMVTDGEFENALGGLWDDAFYRKHGQTVDEFFDTIRESRCGESGAARAEATLQKNALLDYKSYLVFDMKEIHDDGDEISLKRGIGSGSTGEQLLPFYIVLIASMARRCKTNRQGQEADTLRCILIDEAFNKIDDERTERMLDVIRSLGLQPIMATPGVNRADFFCQHTGSGFLHRRIGKRIEVSSWFSVEEEGN